MSRISQARSDLEAARHSGVRPGDQRPFEDELLAALEALASALADAGVPMPRRLHAEISLYRSLGSR